METWGESLIGLATNRFWGCPLARLMYLMPWSRSQTLSLDLVGRIIFGPPCSENSNRAPAEQAVDLQRIPAEKVVHWPADWSASGEPRSHSSLFRETEIKQGDRR